MVLLSSSWKEDECKQQVRHDNAIVKTHLGTGDGNLHLTTVSTHQGLELLTDALKEAETVVLSQGLQEILDDVALVVTGDLLEFLDDLLLVAGAEGGGSDDAGQLAVGLEGLSEAGESLGRLVESGGLGRGSVLFIIAVSSHSMPFRNSQMNDMHFDAICRRREGGRVNGAGKKRRL